jgi:hypothetical protein
MEQMNDMGKTEELEEKPLPVSCEISGSHGGEHKD